MKRTILVLTLTLLLSSAAPAASLDNGDVAIPTPSRSLSSGDQGNTVSNPGNLNTDFNGIQLNSGVMLYLIALLY
jgi:hypothetical protein